MSIDRRFAPSPIRGFTLIELVVFIVIVSVGLAGILSVLNVTVRHSADPVIRKNLLAIAEALIEEVTAQPFTWCDPNDANAETATGVGDCAATVEVLGPEGAETRGSATSPFDNVNDYYVAAGLTLDPVSDASGTATYAGYAATINITAEALNGVVAADALRIGVTVSHGGDSLTVEGYRTRHSPNLLP